MEYPLTKFLKNKQQRKWDFALPPIPWTKQEQIMLLKVWLHQNQNAHYTKLLHSLLCFEKFQGSLHEKIQDTLKSLLQCSFGITLLYRQIKTDPQICNFRVTFIKLHPLRKIRQLSIRALSTSLSYLNEIPPSMQTMSEVTEGHVFNRYFSKSKLYVIHYTKSYSFSHLSDNLYKFNFIMI